METYLLIFGIQVLYVSVFTVRLLIMMGGRTLLASVIGFVEVLIYMLGLNYVLSNINSSVTLIIYCIGFSFGIYIGSTISAKFQRMGAER